MKRAMSPLFSTIVLIGFAMALGGIVMSWGKSGYTIEKPQKPTEGCEKTSLTLIGYEENRGICSKEGKLYFIIQNSGEIDLDGVKVSILGTEGIYSSIISKRMRIADIEKLDFEYSNVGQIKKIIFVPRFILLGEENLCPKKGFSVENVGEC